MDWITYRLPDGDESDTIYDAVQQYVEQYWDQQAEQMAWAYFGHPVHLMAETVTVEVRRGEEEVEEEANWAEQDREGEDQDPEYEVVTVADYNEDEIVGRIITVFETGETDVRHATIVTRRDLQERETVKIDDPWIGDLALERLGQMVTATVVDNGAGPRLVDIRTRE